MVIPKNVVHFTCLILLPLMFISALLILYFLPFGVKIMKFVFLVFNNNNNNNNNNNILYCLQNEEYIGK